MWLIVFFFLVILVGFPISLALGVVPAGYLLITEKFPLTIVPFMMFEMVNNFSLIAIPLFILGGNIISKIGVTEKLIAFCNEIVGRMRGGLSHVNVLVSTIFGGMNGSAVGDAAAVGAIIIKPMIKTGFPPAYSAAVTAISGTISSIIPPSIPFILYTAAVPEVSIGALFVGGIVPGVMMCLAQCVAGYFVSVKRQFPKVEHPFRVLAFWHTIVDAVPAFILVAIILFGLRSGVFTPTEVASVMVAYALFLGFGYYRNMSIRMLLDTLYETAITVGIIFLVIACSAPFMWVITRLGVPEAFTQVIVGIGGNAFFFWLIIGLFLIALGMVIEGSAILLVVCPMIFEVVKRMGLDPFTSSIAMVILVIIGTSTPPVGVSLFVTCSIAGSRIEDVGRECIPFILATLTVVVIILLFPDLAKFLPRLFGYRI